MVGAFGAVGTAVVQLVRAKGCIVLTAARRDTADINLLKDPRMKGAKASQMAMDLTRSLIP